MDSTEEETMNIFGGVLGRSLSTEDKFNTKRLKSSNQSGPVPLSYRCNICSSGGHWIKDCPTKLDPRYGVRKSTGIPRSQMLSVATPNFPGSLMTPDGRYAVRAVDHAAALEKNKAPPPVKIPQPLICPICHSLMTDAVVISCCSTSFCEECINISICNSVNPECPSCKENDIAVSSISANAFLRKAVNKFKEKIAEPEPVPSEPQPNTVAVSEERSSLIPGRTRSVSSSSESGYKSYSETLSLFSQKEPEAIFDENLDRNKRNITQDDPIVSEPSRDTLVRDVNVQSTFQQDILEGKDDQGNLTQPEPMVVTFNKPAPQQQQPPPPQQQQPPPAPTVNHCEILTIDSPDAKYVNMIKTTISQFGITVDVMIPRATSKTSSLIVNLAKRGTLFVLVVRPDNVIHQSISVHLLRGPKILEHRNMPLRTAYSLVQENYLDLKRKEIGTVPGDMKNILHFILEDKKLNDGQYNSLITFLQDRRQRQFLFDRMGGDQPIRTQRQLAESILKIIAGTDDISAYAGASEWDVMT